MIPSASWRIPVQRLKVTILPLDVPCSGPVTDSGEILTTGKSHGKKSDGFSRSSVTPTSRVRPCAMLSLTVGIIRCVTGGVIQTEVHNNFGEKCSSSSNPSNGKAHSQND
jgi:hypothetical protein